MEHLVSNYRLGWATNSSSAHHVVKMRRQSLIRERPPEWPDNYGWEQFTLVSPEEKSDYFAAGAGSYYRRKRGLSDDDVALLVSNAFPLCSDGAWNRTIDHQSQIVFPEPIGDAKMSDLWLWIRSHIINDDTVVVLGGHDNDGEHPLYEESTDVEFGETRRNSPWYWRYHRHDIPFHEGGRFARLNDSGALTIFTNGGNKYRLVGNDGSVATASRVPEMVDLTITNYCKRGCDFCYRGCDYRGEHADTQSLRNIAYALGEAGVFEVAIGGGEPTEHPEFPSILGSLTRNGVTPNFSTGDMHWLSDGKIVNAVREHCGSVAFSTQNASEANEWFILSQHYEIPDPTIHYIVGLNPINELETILSTIDGYYHSRIVLLQFKPIGRGKNLKSYPYREQWAEIVEGSNAYRDGKIALDSGMASLAESAMTSVDPRTLGAEDGKFTMYIDAVGMKAAAHSFVTSSDEMQDIEPYNGSIMEAWQAISSQ